MVAFEDDVLALTTDQVAVTRGSLNARVEESTGDRAGAAGHITDTSGCGGSSGSEASIAAVNRACDRGVRRAEIAAALRERAARDKKQTQSDDSYFPYEVLMHYVLRFVSLTFISLTWT